MHTRPPWYSDTLDLLARLQTSHDETDQHIDDSRAAVRRSIRLLGDTTDAAEPLIVHRAR